MLPGGYWEPATRTIDRGPDRAGFYNPDRMRRWLDDHFDQTTFDRHHPASGPLHREEVDGYLERLNDVPDMAFCEDLTVRVKGVERQDVPIDVSFQIAAGRLSILDEPLGEPNLLMEVPLKVLRHLIQDGASWDEAHVGFWCRFTRTPDVYAAGFWRLVQAPYYLRPAEPPEMPLSVEGAPGLLDANVIDLIERYGPRVERILGRYGLNCVGCPHAPGESVRSAAHRHGVESARAERLIRELTVVLRGELEPASTP